MSMTLKDVYFLQDLNESELETISGIAVTRDFAKGETVVEGGVVLEHFYIIQKGSVSLSVTMDSGDDMVKADEEIIGRLKSGECFGEFSLLDGEPASTNVVAESDLTVYEIEKKALMELIGQNHGVCKKILLSMLKTLVARIRKTDKDLVMSRYFERMR